MTSRLLAIMETTNMGFKEDRRLWIGDLDPRVSEYQLLKLLQKYGTIEKFDLLFHRSGLQAGQPRGYAFVTYSKKEEAESAKDSLNNVLVGQKYIKVTWAHSMPTENIEKPKPTLVIPALAMSKSEPKTDRESKIQAIEAKLKLMEKKAEDELKINDTVASKPPVIIQYQFNKQQTNASSGSNSVKHKIPNPRRHDRYSKPYNRHKSRR